MKLKNLLLTGVFLGLTGLLMAQSPQRFNYQAVARDGSGNVIASSPVGIRIQLHQTTPGGTVVYSETHAPTTTNIGLMNLQIGGGTVTSGTFNTIDWAAGPYYVEIGMDPTGGTTYTNMGTQQLLSVPYALYAGNGFSGDYNDLTNAPTNVSAFTNDAGYITNPDDADADPNNENQTVSAGPGIGVVQTGQDFEITNTAPDQTVTLTQGGSTTITGTYPNFTISSTDNVNDADADPNNENQTVSAGTGVSINQVGQDFQVINTAPDQTVTLTQGGSTTITGTYPNFTISSTDNVDDADANPTNENQTVSAGAGITVNQVGQDFQVINSAPDQTVTLTQGGSTTITGTYPNFTISSSGLSGTGTANYLPKFTAATNVGNSQIQDDGNSVGINTGVSALYRLNVYENQLTADGDGQATIYGYRTRDSQNDATAYDTYTSNCAVKGYNFWGDLYTFGVGGFSYNDYNRTGGVIGAKQDGSYWGSLGYRNSGLTNYGVYGSTGYANGAGYLPNSSQAGVGGGFFGSMLGSVSKGRVMGQLNAGELFATYNVGDVYTSGKNIELVTAGNQKVAAYSVTSTEATVYKKGKTQLVNGTAYIRFDQNYASLLGDAPVVTVTPMGACNGVYISSVDKNGFTIVEQNNGTSNVEISWISVGDRVDANTHQVPEALKSNQFDNNLQDFMFDDGNKEGKAKAMWWDGTTIQFGEMPSELLPKPKTEGQK